jgi:hypothetical protein
MDFFKRRERLWAFLTGLGMLSFVGGCQKPAAQTAGPIDVEVIAVEQRDVPVTREWVGVPGQRLPGQAGL